MLVDFYKNDKLIISAAEQENKSSLFKSFYYWQTDTLSIDGGFGLFGGFGFSLKIINGTATLFHIVAADEFPEYAYNENDSLIYRLEVQCSDTRIILSEIPDSAKNQIIYGYVEFQSGDYFATNGYADGLEILPRNKYRLNMKIYFKSAILNL